MKYIRIGKIVNTHGIKGELRIMSDFRYKDKVFVPNFKFYVGDSKKEFIVNSYRFHKVFDMVTFRGFNSINDIEYLKGKYVYINENDLILDNNEFYSGNLIGYDVIINNKSIGKISEVLNMPANEVLRVNKTLIPYVTDFVNKIDIDNKKIYINNIRGLYYED